MTATGWEGILDEGETILWQGRPDTAITWHPRPPSSVVFFRGFLVFAFAGPGVWATWRSDLPELWLKTLVFAVLVLLLAYGLNGLGGYAFTRAYARRFTRYALTNRRALIFIDLPFLPMQIESHRIDALMPLQYDPRGPGSVWFARQPHFIAGEINPKESWVGSTPFGFERIADARAVFGMMRSLTMGET